MIHPYLELTQYAVGQTGSYNCYLIWDTNKLFIGNLEPKRDMWKGVKNYQSRGAFLCVVYAQKREEVIDKLYDLALQFSPELQDLYQRYPVEN